MSEQEIFDQEVCASWVLTDGEERFTLYHRAMQRIKKLQGENADLRTKLAAANAELHDLRAHQES